MQDLYPLMCSEAMMSKKEGNEDLPLVHRTDCARIVLFYRETLLLINKQL